MSIIETYKQRTKGKIMQNDLIEFKPVPEFQKAVVLHDKHLAKGQNAAHKERPFTVDRREYNVWLKQKGFM